MKSRVPDKLDDERAMTSFLDSVDRRQLALSEIADLAGGATLAEVITKINAMLATQRTR